ncbi:MAG: transcriptional initiation protein Tat, partial [Pseudomonadota bacterium]|nr:transcriptional initiation protein Tat [Pseudomonadota bacterium]
MKNTKRMPLPGYLAGLEPLSRRSFLRSSVLASAAFTSGCASLLGRRDAPETLQYHSLNTDEARVIKRLTEVMLPTARYGLPSSTQVVPTIENVDAMAQ